VTFERSYVKFDHHIRLRESTQMILTPHFHPKIKALDIWMMKTNKEKLVCEQYEHYKWYGSE
jgi:hypothetical protein